LNNAEEEEEEEVNQQKQQYKEDIKEKDEELSDESGDEVGFVIKNNNDEKKTQISFNKPTQNALNSENNQRIEDRTAFQGENYVEMFANGISYAGFIKFII
jgi:hypothetical protein